MPHLRQVIEFKTTGKRGDIKDNYQVTDNYRILLNKVIKEYLNKKN